MRKHVECDAIFQYRKSPFRDKKGAQIFARLDEYIQIRKETQIWFLKTQAETTLKYFL